MLFHKASLVCRIRRSIAAIVVIYLLGGMVLGSSMMWFDFKLKTDPIPQSMVEQHTTDRFDSSLWYALLMAVAAVGLPLGMYVLTTLHECGERKDEQSCNYPTELA